MQIASLCAKQIGGGGDETELISQCFVFCGVVDLPHSVLIMRNNQNSSINYRPRPSSLTQKDS